ncbi:GNAT family N-acetyltransferase [archaeon]|nr:GNAT family N-acetyltransferase [archaeon]
MPKVTIRPQRVSDAKRFFEIITNPNFKFTTKVVKSVEEERKWLKGNRQREKGNIEHNFTILYDGYVVGAIGMKMDQHHKHIGEIGYIVDEKYHGLGIATEAVRQIEKIGFRKLGLERIEIRTSVKNKPSQRVAIKAGYKKEGILRHAFNLRGKFVDNYVYSKIKND